MKVSDIISVLEQFAPLSVQESWDNSGLIIGSPDNEVHGVLIGFDCTPALVDEAVACGADMIITHHPLIFGGIRKISPQDPVGSAILKAAAGGINVYAAHTTADKVVGGVSWIMAERMHLRDIEILSPDVAGRGLGVVGRLPEPLASEEAVAYVKETLGIEHQTRVSKPIRDKISKIAFCGGSGSSLIETARQSGAGLYVSADISYHHFFTPDDFMIMDIGHFESEVSIVDVLFSILKKYFSNFAVRISENIQDSNPVSYL